MSLICLLHINTDVDDDDNHLMVMMMTKQCIEHFCMMALLMMMMMMMMMMFSVGADDDVDYDENGYDDHDNVDDDYNYALIMLLCHLLVFIRHKNLLSFTRFFQLSSAFSTLQW